MFSCSETCCPPRFTVCPVWRLQQVLDQRDRPLCSWLNGHFESSSGFPAPKLAPSLCSNPAPSARGRWCAAAGRSKRIDSSFLHFPEFLTFRIHCTAEIIIIIIISFFTSKQGKRLASSMKRGRRTNLMKPVWDEGLVTLSRSMNGVTGRPSNFSTSLWGEVENIVSIMYSYLEQSILSREDQICQNQK